MTEAKFTKGPWEVDVGCTQSFVVSGNEFILESNTDINTGKMEERIANANLIAAAPEMYEMLTLAIRYMDGDSIEDFTYHYKELNDLLAKARGEQ